MGEPLIRAERLDRVYRIGTSSVHALRAVDLLVQRGEMVAIMGASGSGKSTLMNLLGCLDAPTSGVYWLNGVRVDQLGKNGLAEVRNREIGFVFQGFNLLARTSALENVELPLLYDRSESAARAAGRRSLSGASASVSAWDHPTELSGGQQRRPSPAPW
jgi:putative ABC transport system ATP-binding protein